MDNDPVPGGAIPCYVWIGTDPSFLILFGRIISNPDSRVYPSDALDYRAGENDKNYR